MELEKQEKSNLLTEDETTPIYGDKKRKGDHKLLLLALTAALICFVIATIVLAVLLGIKEEENESTADCGACTTPTCLEATSFLMQGLDTSVAPCEDFYKYSCGNWEANNVIPEGFGRYSTFGELGTSNSITLKKALEEPVPEGDDGSVSKAKYMYKQCMDLEAISNRGAEPLREIVGLNGGWALINVSEAEPWSLENNLFMEHYYGSDAFFSFGLEADDFNSNEVVIKVDYVSMSVCIESMDIARGR